MSKNRKISAKFKGGAGTRGSGRGTRDHRLSRASRRPSGRARNQSMAQMPSSPPIPRTLNAHPQAPRVGSGPPAVTSHAARWGGPPGRRGTSSTRPCGRRRGRAATTYRHGETLQLSPQPPDSLAFPSIRHASADAGNVSPRVTYLRLQARRQCEMSDPVGRARTHRPSTDNGTYRIPSQPKTQPHGRSRALRDGPVIPPNGQKTR